MRRLFAHAVVVGALVLVGATTAHAGGAGFVGGAPAGSHVQGRIVGDQRTDVFGERRVVGAQPAPPCRDVGRCGEAHVHRGAVVVVPQTVYVTSGASCFVPGYWTYQWVPQTAWYNVWIPAQYSADWQWIDAHYESRPYTTGSYQPLWVPDRWGC